MYNIRHVTTHTDYHPETTAKYNFNSNETNVKQFQVPIFSYWSCSVGQFMWVTETLLLNMHAPTSPSPHIHKHINTSNIISKPMPKIKPFFLLSDRLLLSR